MKIEFENLHFNRLPPATAKAFKKCSSESFFSASDWYLAGGTALALQVGHRESVDLDFFTSRKKFDEVSVERELLAIGGWETTFREAGTVYGVFSGAKMSLISYPFFVPEKPFLQCGSVHILQPEDIAVMKIIAISQRGRKRDFIDLYWYAHNREPIGAVLRRVVAQYPGQNHNIPHFIKSLTYFADAESDPMPNLFFTVTWNEVKKFFQAETVKAARELLGIN